MTKNTIRQAICTAFAGVRLGGGMTWQDAELLDCGVVAPVGGELNANAGLAPRYAPDDWRDLLEGDWECLPNAGGFNFLDAEGFRYYIAPAMILSLDRDDSSEFLAYSLTRRGVDKLSSHFDESVLVFTTERAGELMSKHFDGHVSLFSAEQTAATAAFVAYWANLEIEHDPWFSCWTEAFDSYWRQFV
ncbi:MAG: hypothetical protein K2Q20_12695 [Phycisphaerales bacterium]|nr:hypothetical protein [Phycisphaerales bacterium]